MQRRLTVILAADVVGFSRLMGEDEAKTLVSLTAQREELIDPKVRQYKGRTIKLMGDGSLMEFPSVVDAVQFAVEVQCAMRDRNADISEDRQIRYRMGINIGDVIVEGEDLYGNGVNVASRLEGLVDADGICLSGPVHTQIKGKLDLTFDYLGEKKVKNIAEPVSVYCVRLDEKATALVTPVPVVQEAAKPARWYGPVASTAFVALLALGGAFLWQPWTPGSKLASIGNTVVPLAEKPSIAVLPFKNLSGEKEQEYFSDGITHDIITDLSKFKGLFVIASNSAFSYKGKVESIQQVAKELGVQYVLEGSVQRASDRVRINAQLIDATTGKHLWAERYNRDANDLFDIQDGIIETIIASVSFKLDAVERARALRKATSSLEAYDYYLRGRDAFLLWTKEDNTRAGELFRKAIELDPNYAKAYANLAWVHGNEWRFNWSNDPDTSLDQALEIAQQALALDPDDHESHWALGFVYLFRREFDRSITEYERALALNSKHAEFLVDIADALVYMGRTDSAIAQYKEAMQINPRFPEWYFWRLGWAYYHAGRFEEAFSTLRKMNNPAPKVHLTMAVVYVRLGRLEEARAEVAEFLKKEPEFTLEAVKRHPYKDQAQLDQMIDDLQQAGFPE